MDCVACREPMIVLEHDGVEIDYCLDCGGIWLDAGELGILLDNPDDVTDTLAQVEAGGTAKHSRRRCPICAKKMEEITIGTDRPVVLDHCSEAHGLWFDRGELEGVLHVFEKGPDSKVAGLLEHVFGKKR